MVRITQRVWIRIKSIYLRITLNKTIAAFFLFTFTFCFLHSFVQGFLYTMDWNANALTSAIVTTARVPRKEFAWLTRDKTDNGTIYDLKLCDAIPMEKAADDNPCVTIFQSNETGPMTIPGGFRKRELVPSVSRREDLVANLASNGTFVLSIGAYLEPIVDTSSGVITSLQLTQSSINGGNVTVLDEQCTRVVLYADQVLSNSRREEIALISSEFWIFGISVFAIIYGSIPHLIAAFLLRLLSSGWSAYSIWRTQDIHQRFKALLDEGACGVDLFPGYAKSRTLVQLGDVGLNVIASLLMIYFVMRMSKTYSTFLFQRIGPPDSIAKIYRLLHVLLACLQISVFVLITSACLWLDQIFAGAIATVSSHTPLYVAAAIVILLLLPLWLIVGWRSLKREEPRAFLFFLAVGVLLEAGWSLMYDSLVWRWTWIQWPFFASLAVAAQAALLACIAVGAACRWNFGKGLREYLAAAEALADDDFEPEMFDQDRKGDPEKGKLRELQLGRSGSQTRRPARARTLDLDFGARQPLPPVSPPAYVLPTNAGQPPLPAPPARPQSGMMVLALPTLGKNDPWQKTEPLEPEEEFVRMRL